LHIKSYPGRAAIGALLLSAMLATGGCSSSGSPSTSAPQSSSSAPTTTTAKAPATSPTGATVTIKNFSFGSPITVTAGATVTVHNADGTTHSLAGDAGEFYAENVFAGSSTSFVAPMTPRTYKFHCNFHASMHGALIVTG
jgi:plastocyanin